MNIELMQKKIDKFFTPENIAKYKKKLADAEIIKNHHVSKIQKYYNKVITNTDEDVERELLTFLNWERKWEEKQLDVNHKQTSSNIFDAVVEWIQEQEGYCTELDRSELEFEDSSFALSGFKMGNFKFILFVGQGSFYRVRFKDIVVFQNV